MCVMLYIPTGKNVSKETLRLCFQSNPHSIGYMFPNLSGVQVWKGFDFEKFYESYSLDKKENPNVDFCVHFRIATSGKKDLDNCHPFTFGNLHLMHNGVLPRYWGSALENDTRHFIREVLAPLSQAIDIMGAGAGSIAARELIEHYIDGDKFIIMDDGGRVQIIGEVYGDNKNGVWFSNLYWEPVKLSKKEKRKGKFAVTSFNDFREYERCSICFGPSPILGWDICEDCANTYRVDSSDQVKGA